MLVTLRLQGLSSAEASLCRREAIFVLGYPVEAFAEERG